MKKKPNTEQFNFKKDPSEFLDAGSVDLVKRIDSVPSESTVVNSRVYREQKVFRLPIDLINALKRESYERTVASGNRVTETELVEKALKSYLKI